MALAEDLAANEKAVHKTFADLVSPDEVIGVEQFFKVYHEVMDGKRKAYLIDVRTRPEFCAFHMEGTDHNVHCFKDGVMGWAVAGHLLVNQFTGSFKIFE